MDEQRQQYEQRVSACDDYVKSNVEKMEKLKEEYEALGASVKVSQPNVLAISAFGLKVKR